LSEEASKALGDTDTVAVHWNVRVISLSIAETNAFCQVIPVLILLVLTSNMILGLKEKNNSCLNYIKEATVCSGKFH